MNLKQRIKKRIKSQKKRWGWKEHGHTLVGYTGPIERALIIKYCQKHHYEFMDYYDPGNGWELPPHDYIRIIGNRKKMEKEKMLENLRREKQRNQPCNCLV